MSRLLPHHARVLDALNERTQPDGEMCTNFKPLVEALGMERSEVRRIVRVLARKGYAEYWRGLANETDLSFAGAGYCVTHKGREIAEALT